MYMQCKTGKYRYVKILHVCWVDCIPKAGTNIFVAYIASSLFLFAVQLSVAWCFAISVAQGKPKKGAAPIRRLIFRNPCCKRKTKKGSRSHPSLDLSQSMLQKENQKREPLLSVAWYFAINVAQGKPKEVAASVSRLIFGNQCCTRKTKGGSRFCQWLDISQSMLHKENQRR
jgi:hypothetical protein